MTKRDIELLITSIAICVIAFCALMLIIAPPIGIILIAPAILAYIIYKYIKIKSEKTDYVNQINTDLDEIEAGLDEQLAIDKSNGKIVRLKSHE